MITYADQTSIDQTLQKAQAAFRIYRLYSLKQRAALMRTIAGEIEALGAELIETAVAETRLPEARLAGEKGRTVFQWRSYADAVERGEWLNASIDTADPARTPPKPDVRKTLTPLGPVAVFGASNFPFAFSTAGGDTASAIGAGCPVILKAHPGHEKTSAIMAGAISSALKKADAPEGLFSHIYCADNLIAQYLVSHPLLKAVGFTGSFRAGKALTDLAAQRPEPIPVYAEMGSVNPVLILPEKLQAEAAMLAKQYTASLTLGTGQFCTNPGIVIAIKGEPLDQFLEALRSEIASALPAPMLNNGIWKNYESCRARTLSQKGVSTLVIADDNVPEGFGTPTVAVTDAGEVLANNNLLEEVFGPFALVIRCEDAEEMKLLAQRITGQLTASFLATTNDLQNNPDLVAEVQEKCGRILFNNFPTGVEVCLSMHHGGPYPSTSGSLFTSVGADALKRFARPLSFQNWPDSLLPEELKNGNPLGIWRTVNNTLTKDTIG